MKKLKLNRFVRNKIEENELHKIKAGGICYCYCFCTCDPKNEVMYLGSGDYDNDTVEALYIEI